MIPTSDTPVAESRAVDARWRRYDRYAALVVVTLVVVLVFVSLTGDGASTVSGRLGGDYPAFYGAGSILLDGDIDELYDPVRQRAAQRELLGEGDVLFFAYPPPVAVAYAPLAALPYRVSYLVHSLAMLAALAGALALLRPVVPVIARFPGISLAIAFTFYPMFRAVTGGQNTALTVLLVVVALRLERGGRPVAAGLAVAALLYKPQFGIPFAALLLVPPRWAMLRGWALGAAGFYGFGALVAGPAWVGEWWSDATNFAEINEGVNGFLFISLPGMISNWLGSGSGAGRVLWLVAIVVAVAGALAVWITSRGVAERWTLTAVAVVLVAPQALYYEAGVLAPAIAVAGVPGPAVALIWTLSWTPAAADALGWSPLGLIVPVALVWMVRRSRRQEPRPA